MYRYRPQKISLYLFLLAKIALLGHIILPWPHLSSCSVPFDSFLSTETPWDCSVQYYNTIPFPPPPLPPLFFVTAVSPTLVFRPQQQTFLTLIKQFNGTKIRELIIVHNNKTQDYNIFFYFKKLNRFQRQRLDRGRKKWVRRGRGQKGVCGHKRWGQNWRGGERGRTRQTDQTYIVV